LSSGRAGGRVEKAPHRCSTNPIAATFVAAVQRRRADPWLWCRRPNPRAPRPSSLRRPTRLGSWPAVATRATADARWSARCSATPVPRRWSRASAGLGARVFRALSQNWLELTIDLENRSPFHFYCSYPVKVW
jgi:hypothetical protein